MAALRLDHGPDHDRTPDTAAGRIRRAVERALGPDADFGPVDAVAATATGDIAHFLHPHFDDDARLEVLGVGVPASPGAACGRIVLSAEAAIDAAERGEQVILVRPETGPEDVLGMQSAVGILTSRGGLASHAAVVARGWGIPAVVGLKTLQVESEAIMIGEHRIAAGDPISIDGHSGEVYLGVGQVETAHAPREMETLLAWADALRAGRFGVRANADDDASARHARSLGADGIGLCRTEHMFLAEDRLPLVRRLILSDDPRVDDEALAALEDVQARDFEALLEAMDGLPVTVRLLDPPLHEFLPPMEPLIAAEARGELDAEAAAELAAVRRMHEVNPMIGTRGVRLGMVKPGLYPMQVRAVSRAVTALQGRGLNPLVEIMIPLVVDVSELKLARDWVEQAESEAGVTGPGRQAVSVGTMIETPRAALVAADLAGVADFFSFGTNDLTQLTFAFSRDDVEAELLPRYMDRGLLPANPFEVLDQVGVGFLVRHAIEAARAARPSIKIGACGEQAGDPESARFLVASGLDYVSCSPFRLPVVRLAVAQALLELGLVDGRHLQQPEAQLSQAVTAAPAVTAVTAAPADAAFRVIHALRIKGFATTDLVAEMTGVDPEWVTGQLDRLRNEELVKFHEARGFWQLTPAGKEHHSGLLPGCGPEALERVRVGYDRFLELNVGFKELCISWQVRDGEPNDHSDADYDAGRVEALLVHHRASEPVLDDFAGGVERLGLYRPRLQDALGRVRDGDRDAFTGVMKRSYHDVWMELHEDLLALLAITRASEGSF
ncbi:MAG TPA: putative PEP-binding protein [Acidimicrobiales bacterium]|nr:putative PEP-binding protein [Acidimicrobiales bacterium]